MCKDNAHSCGADADNMTAMSDSACACLRSASILVSVLIQNKPTAYPLAKVQLSQGIWLTQLFTFGDQVSMDWNHGACVMGVCDAVRALIKAANFGDRLSMDSSPHVIIVCEGPHLPAQPAL